MVCKFLRISWLRISGASDHCIPAASCVEEESSVGSMRDSQSSNEGVVCVCVCVWERETSGGRTKGRVIAATYDELLSHMPFREPATTTPRFEQRQDAM